MSSYKIILIRTPNSKQEIPLVISAAKYKKLKENSSGILKLSEREKQLTQELVNENDKEGGSIFGTILSALPIVGDLFGSIFKGKGIRLENSGGMIQLDSMKKKIPTFSAVLQ